MAGDKKGTILSATEGGVSGEHPAPEPFKFLVGPTTTDQFNTAHLPLVAIACWRTDDNRFAFDSSFPAADLEFVDHPGKPADRSAGDQPSDIRLELAKLTELIKAHPGCPLSVFGHADPVGSDDYNKLLSGRRAMAIYALLIFNTDPNKAVKLWKQVASEESWGKDHHEMMQSFTGLPVGSSKDDLITAYMKGLCPPDLKLDPKKHFVARGADSGGKGDYQGCGEFNPVLLFSKEDQAKYDQARQRNGKDDQPTIQVQNAANAPNRRVMVLMFRSGSRVDPAKWPCPRATEGVAECKKRFFSDGEKRRSTHPPGTDRKFESTEDTFACRFYQRISSGSPCHQVRELVPLTIRLINVDDEVLANLAYKLEVGAQVFHGHTTSEGFIRQFVQANATTGKLTLPKPNRTVALTIQSLAPPNQAEGAQARLNNLGFFASDALHDNLDEQTKRSLERFEVAHVPPIGLTKTSGGAAKGQGIEGVTSSDGNVIAPEVSETLTEIYGS